jgi:phage antirepressor YoqD-like protein
MKQLQTFSYNGSAVTFQLANGDVMVNLTEMAKPFGKLTADFFRLEQTSRFIKALEEKYSVMGNPITEIRQGGINQGTWAHQKLALKFAAWLSPEFELWVYDRIEELMKNGYTKLDTISRKELALLLLQAEEEKERIQQRAQLQTKQLKEAAPKVEYFDTVLQSDSLHCANVIAKELGMSAVSLNRKLNSLGVQYKQGDTWVLYHQHQHKGYTRTRTHHYTDSRTGEQRTAVHTYWTEKGRMFIHQLARKHGFGQLVEEPLLNGKSVL